jgi:hypothetical protein
MRTKTILLTFTLVVDVFIFRYAIISETLADYDIKTVSRLEVGIIAFMFLITLAIQVYISW